jgi:TonB family protein
VYSPSDPDVQPPVLTRAQFRRTETSDTVAMSTVEVLVDEFGTVERVRLQSRRTSLHDRMLISAIKAWRFRPALRAGTPVRYTLRMAVPREETR